MVDSEEGRSTRGSPVDSPSGRSLGVAGFVVLVVVYLAVLQGVGQLLTIGRPVEYVRMSTIDQLWRSVLAPVGLSVVLVFGVIAWLGWRRPVWVDDRPVQRWVIVVPVLMVVSIVVVTDYAGLAAKPVTFVVLLLLGSLLVGFGEEAMFRGIGVTVFRRRGFTEGKVALWSTVLFGVAHASNILTEGLSAFAQVMTTIIAGYFFYLIRRRSGGLLVPALVHGLWDFSLISGLVTPGRINPLFAVALVVEAVLLVVVLLRRKHIEPGI